VLEFSFPNFPVKPLTYLASILAALGVSGLAESARAIALPLDGEWHVYEEVAAPQGGFHFAETWTFKSNSQVQLSVVDLYDIGDIFKVTINGKDEFTGAFDNSVYTSDRAETAKAAWEGSTFSRGSWLLMPGIEYTISIQTSTRTTGSSFDEAGSVGIRAVVPEGGVGLVLWGVVLGGLGGWRHWSRRGR
jgi:hypothetical protein